MKFISKYNYNADYFNEINSEGKAYWLGFLYADGCINQVYRNEKLKSMNLELCLSDKDCNHIMAFLNDIESNVPIKNKLVKINAKEFLSKRIHICSTEMCRDLIDKGCMPKKSLILNFPNDDILPNELKRHFIRGYFDGDGCIFFKQYNKFNKLRIIMVGTIDMLDGILKTFYDSGIKNINRYLSEKGKAFQLEIAGYDNLIKIYNYFYHDTHIYLDRKFYLYRSAIEYIKETRISQSGKAGVYLDKRTNKWVASITQDGRKKQLGSFSELSDAIIVREEAEIQKRINKIVV